MSGGISTAPAPASIARFSKCQLTDVSYSEINVHYLGAVAVGFEPNTSTMGPHGERQTSGDLYARISRVGAAQSPATHCGKLRRLPAALLGAGVVGARRRLRPGTITVDLAARVVPGSVTGVEPTDDALSLARAEAQLHRLSNISFTTSDVHKLDFPDDAFDVVHAHQVLQHVADPVRALQEMRRVCTPGGIVAARDADYSGFIWFPKLPALDRWLDLYERAARANGGEPDAGRRLLSWARAAGFDDVTPTASVWCFATASAREWWGLVWADRILQSDLAHQLVDSGLATAAQLEEISTAWRVGRGPGRLAGDTPR